MNFTQEESAGGRNVSGHQQTHKRTSYERVEILRDILPDFSANGAFAFLNKLEKGDITLHFQEQMEWHATINPRFLDVLRVLHGAFRKIDGFCSYWDDPASDLDDPATLRMDDTALALLQWYADLQDNSDIIVFPWRFNAQQLWELPEHVLPRMKGSGQVPLRHIEALCTAITDRELVTPDTPRVDGGALLLIVPSLRGEEDEYEEDIRIPQIGRIRDAQGGIRMDLCWRSIHTSMWSSVAYSCLPIK